MTQPDHYDTLGVAPDAKPETIKAAYRALMMKHHPDVASSPESHDIAAAVGIAYGVLSDPAKRAIYDHPTNGDPDGEPDVDQADVAFTDEWGEQAAWTPPPPPPPPQTAEAEPGRRPAGTAAAPPPPAEPKVRYRHPGRYAGLIGALTAVAVLVITITSLAAAPFASLTTPLLKAAPPVAGATLGLALAAYRARRAQPVDLWVGAALAAIVVVWLGRSALESFALPARAAQALAVTFAGAGLALHRQRRQRRLDAVLPMRSLRQHNLFGALPGGVAADLADKSLQPLGRLRGARIVRFTAPGFSHAVVCGRKVVLVASVLGGAGHYYWSGPSLICDSPATAFPVEVLNVGRHLNAMAQVQVRLGRAFDVRAWLLVHSSAGGSVAVEHATGVVATSAALGVAQIEDFLGDDRAPLVDQEGVVGVVQALAG